jgi:hypothetical protein
MKPSIFLAPLILLSGCQSRLSVKEMRVLDDAGLSVAGARIQIGSLVYSVAPSSFVSDENGRVLLSKSMKLHRRSYVVIETLRAQNSYTLDELAFCARGILVIRVHELVDAEDGDALDFSSRIDKQNLKFEQ